MNVITIMEIQKELLMEIKMHPDNYVEEKISVLEDLHKEMVMEMVLEVWNNDIENNDPVFTLNLQ